MKFIKNYLFLFSILLIIFFYPFLEDTLYGGLISLVLLCISASLCLMVLFTHKRVFYFMIVISFLIIGLDFYILLNPNSYLISFEYLSLTALVSLYAALLFYFLMTSKSLSMADISNAVAIYFLIGIAFGFLYSFIEQIHPGAFSFETSNTNDISGDMIYFSMITLTTAGYGEMLPVYKIAKVLAMMEASLGVLYIAIMIGKLVGISPSQKK